MSPVAKTEQRTNRRVSTDMPIRFRIVDGEGELGKWHRTRTTNIASGGLAFLSKLIIPIGARAELEITLPGKQGELKCEANVVRIVGEFVEGEDVEYGTAFDMETLGDPEKLAMFVQSVDIVPLLERMAKEEATDLHLTADMPPMYRIRQRLVPGTKRRLSADMVETLVRGALNAERRERLERERELYFPFILPGVGRWRTCVFYQRGSIEATFQPIDEYVPTVTELGLPEVVRSLALSDGGLILVTGGSRTGKSTTVAAMLRAISHEQEKVITTLEDPIQYVHQNDRSIIKQREVGSDTLSFREGLKNILRQDSDVIFVDDVPDSGVMDMLFRAAETRRLVITTLPTEDSISGIRRILGMYREERTAPTLHTIASVLRGVISQRLVRSVDGSEMVLIIEVLMVNESVRNAIWTNKLDQLPNLMLSSAGSITVDSSLRSLILRGKLDYERASKMSRDPDGLRRASAV